MNYSDKLRDPRWQKKRLSILNRDNFICQLCLDEKTELHVHHHSYERGKEPWEYEDDNFITYCKICHKVVESYKTGCFSVKRIIKTSDADGTVYVKSLISTEVGYCIGIDGVKLDGTVNHMVVLTGSAVKDINTLYNLIDTEFKVEELPF